MSRDVVIEAWDFTGVADPYNPGLDYPTAWAIQRECGDRLEHAPRCSSVAGWHPLAGPGFLCDCGALAREAERRAEARTPVTPADEEGI